MRKPLYEILALTASYQCPVICAGDIFDKYKEDTELVNYMIKRLRHFKCIYAIPGQHDLPNHNLKQINRSSFQTLVLSKVIKHLSYEKCNGLELYGFPYSIPLAPPTAGGHEPDPDCLQVAVVHDYVWIPGHSFDDKLAPKEKKVSRKRLREKGYNVIVYGDNHKGFSYQTGATTIFNCGTLMRRKSDEENYRPMVGLLHSNGEVQEHFLEIGSDCHLTKEEAAEKPEEDFDMTVLAKELAKLGRSALDFEAAIRQFHLTNKTPKTVQQIIQEAMENKVKE
jgi:DNA repair exonuclease SbcCD nuclease subunit